MKIYTLVDDKFAENCYIVADNDGKCAVIDPASDDALAFVRENSLEPEAVLLTHGHFDHIGGLNAFLGAFDVPVYIHEKDKELLKDGMKNASSVFGFPSVIISAEPTVISDGDTVVCGTLFFKTLHTPGHTDGSVCYFCGDAVFTGDTLFADGVGRTDLYGADEAKMRNSLDMLIKLLPGKTIYPGHNETKKF
ncbi:MAG: MBL fold metallo-hydrolase [Eubacteriales bacterium]